MDGNASEVDLFALLCKGYMLWLGSPSCGPVSWCEGTSYHCLQTLSIAIYVRSFVHLAVRKMGMSSFVRLVTSRVDLTGIGANLANDIS